MKFKLYIFMIVLFCFVRKVFPENKNKDMICIPKGEFIMGAGEADGRIGIQIGEDEVPRHSAFLETYCMDIYETSNGEYKEFIDSTGNKLPNNPTHDYDPFIWEKGTFPEGLKEYPVSLVDWYDADLYCKWKNKRLPSEMEWEKACRGGDLRKFPWGNIADKFKANTYDLMLNFPMPVNSFPNGKSLHGIVNMIGNVSEWTVTEYLSYPGNNYNNELFKMKMIVSRGGGFTNPFNPNARCTDRSANPPNFQHRTLGIRCAVSKE